MFHIRARSKIDKKVLRLFDLLDVARTTINDRQSDVNYN